MTHMVPVLTAPLLDPGAGRVELQLPGGMTIAEMVAAAMPGMTAADQAHLRVTLVTERGMTVLPHSAWAISRPRPGVRVVIRVVPGDGALRSIMMIVVTVVAFALAGPLATAWVGATGIGSLGAATGLITAGLTVVGSMLVSALVPVKAPKADEVDKRYTIGQFKNEIRANQPVPEVMGRIRMAPPFAATSYTEVIGNNQYVRAIFCFGPGPMQISDLKIGDTSIDSYDDVEVEIREGWPDDEPCLLYPRQVLEEATNAELVRPKPRNDVGDVIDGPAIETPIERFTAFDSWACTVIIGFPGGLFKIDDDGDTKSLEVAIRIRQRAPGDIEWIDVTQLVIRDAERALFFRAHTWILPHRGRWEIEVTRLTDERTKSTQSDKTVLAAIQSHRPEYPINSAGPLALASMRIRATYQLSGALDTVTAVCARLGPVWDGEAWLANQPSRNPATAFRLALQGPGNPFPVSDAALDLDALADWYSWCDGKGLKYDRIHDQDETLGDTLNAICAAGRATWRHDGLQWTVVIDRPQALAVDHISPRNSTEFSWSRQYFDPPHGFRVAFQDETSDWESAERIVPWPGHTGEISLTETLEMPGKTDPDEIWIETRRRMYELIYRPDTFGARQDGAMRTATRGDQVLVSTDVLVRAHRAARVTGMTGALIEIDDLVEMADGTDYALRWRKITAEDTVGQSIVRQVVTSPGETRLLQLIDADDGPQRGDIVLFGELGSEIMALRIKGVEAGDDGSALLRMLAAAPEIDALTDAEVPPDWSGRVGTPIDGVLTPKAPVITSVQSIRRQVEEGYWANDEGTNVWHVTGYSTVYDLSVKFELAADEIALLGDFRLQHRLATAEVWEEIILPVAAGGTPDYDDVLGLGAKYPEDWTISGLDLGDIVQLRASVIALDGTEGPSSGILTVTVGSTDDLPGAIDPELVVVTGALGYSTIELTVPSDPLAVSLQLYRVPAGAALDVVTHASGAPAPVSAGAFVSTADGDGTRSNLITGGDLSSPAAWTVDPYWVISDGRATHTPGAADELTQAVALTPGASYRLSFTATGITAGQVTPQLLGSGTVSGDAVTADGAIRQVIIAGSGADTLAFAADDLFEGSIDDVVLFQQTAACVPAGSYDYYLALLNADGWPGPAAGPFTVIIL